MSSGMMDTVPGGEGDQYESIKTVTNPSSKQGGQLGDPETQVDAVQEQEDQSNAEKGEKTAENVRYGQAISEGGFGGETTDSSGGANQEGGLGDAEKQAESGNTADETREAQDYGSGSGIGA